VVSAKGRAAGRDGLGVTSSPCRTEEALSRPLGGAAGKAGWDDGLGRRGGEEIRIRDAGWLAGRSLAQGWDGLGAIRTEEAVLAVVVLGWTLDVPGVLHGGGGRETKIPKLLKRLRGRQIGRWTVGSGVWGSRARKIAVSPSTARRRQSRTKSFRNSNTQL
jgi:hypothetical protein